jgi:hypothetical protein
VLLGAAFGLLFTVTHVAVKALMVAVRSLAFVLVTAAAAAIPAPLRAARGRRGRDRSPAQRAEAALHL